MHHDPHARRPLTDHDRSRLRDAMVSRIRAGMPNPFEPDSPAYAAYAFTRELLGHAGMAPRSALGRQAARALAPTDGAERESTVDLPPLPTERPYEWPPAIVRGEPVGRAFADAIFGEESAGSGGYGAINESSNEAYTALGRYQMQRAALQSVGFRDASGAWTGALGVHEPDDYLRNHHAQDVAFAGYMGVLRRELRRRDAFRWQGDEVTGQSGAAFTISESGLLAAAHREGSYAVRAYLDYLAAQDGNAEGVAYPEGKVGQSGRLLADAFAQIEGRLARFAEIPYSYGGDGGRPLVVPPEERR